MDDGKAEANLQKAIESIASYVEQSAYFIALTPNVYHKDIGKYLDWASYLTRGWCRAELLASLLSRCEFSMLDRGMRAM